MKDDPFRRINRRPERDHAPFEVGRKGLLFTSRFWDWLFIGVVAVIVVVLIVRNP